MSSTELSLVSTRSYRSERRERQARETRERILAVASESFARSGYAATAMRVVAQAAGVSLATVELGFGTKAELLQAAIRFAIRGDGEPVAMLGRPWAHHAQQVSSVAEFLAIVAGILIEAQQRSAGLILAAFEAANQDESMSALADQLRRQRAETAMWIVDELIRRQPLRDPITRGQAIDTIWLLMDPHGFITLTRDRGWSAERFEAWFIDSVDRLLLTGGTAPPHPSPAHSTQPLPKWRTS